MLTTYFRNEADEVSIVIWPDYNILYIIYYIYYIYIYLFHYFYRCEIAGWQGHCLIFKAAGASKRTFPFLWSCLICQLSPGRSLGMSLLSFGDRSFLFHPRERTARRLHNPQRCSFLWCQAPSVPMQPPPPLSGGLERRYGWSLHFSALCRRWRLVSPTLLPVLFFSKLYLASEWVTSHCFSMLSWKVPNLLTRQQQPRIAEIGRGRSEVRVQ